MIAKISDFIAPSHAKIALTYHMDIYNHKIVCKTVQLDYQKVLYLCIKFIFFKIYNVKISGSWFISCKVEQKKDDHKK